MTTEEIRDLAAQVKELIAAQARDLSQYEEVTDISQVSTLPGLKGTGTAATLVRVAMKLLKGADGKTPELRADGANLLWRSEGDGQWQTLCSLEALRGAKVQLRKGGTGIEWKYDNTTEWMTLIPVDELAFKYDDLTPEQKQELTRKPVLSAVDAEKGDEPAGQFTADGEDSAGNPRYRLQLTLPKGDKGDAFTYDDFTPEQIEQLQKPATDIAASVAETEESRVKNEESRISAEAARAEAENKRASAETARASAETARAEAEASRASAEAKRESAESARAAEEAGRAEAEQGRAEAEQARVTAELQRATAEDTRNTAETARNSAESARAAAETERMHEEALRAQSEAARAGAEESRTEAEESRVKNEELRNTAESARADAEQDRQTAEAGRAEAEHGRAGAEESRVTAETARAEAETRRNEELGRLTAECEAAAEGVDEAKAEALAAAETARNLPKIEGGTWRVYDTESKQYLDSGVGATGRSPKIEGGTWWTWDDAAGDYQDTGVSVSSQYVLTKEAVEQVLTGDIASHSHDAQMEEALQPYAKSTDVTAQLAAALEQYVTNAALSAALEAYKLTKAKIEEALTGDITSHNHTTQVTQALAPYAKTAAVDSKLTAYAKTADVNSKVSAAEAKIPTKLSQLQNDNHTVQDAAYVHTDQNFTAALKQKLDGLANYNDSALRSLISAAQAKADKAQANLDKLVSGDASTAIDTFNEIEAFLKGVTDTETLTGLLAQQKSEITADAAAKYQPKGSYAAASHNHDDRYPTKTGGGASGTWPVSVSGSAVKLASRGNLTALTGKNSGETGVNLYQAYNNGYPVSYGNLLHVFAQGASELLMGWSGTSGAVEHLYYRNRRDTTDANWSAWVTVLDSTNFSQYALPKNGKAADADKLGGKAASEYALKSEGGAAGMVCVTMDSAPTQDTLTYTDDKGTHQFKVGDMVKWKITTVNNETSIFLFYILCDIANNNAQWSTLETTAGLSENADIVVITGYTGLPDGWFDQDFGSMGTPPSVRIGNEEFSWDGKPMAIYVDSDVTSGRNNYRVDCPSTNYGSQYYAAYGESFNISGMVRYVTLEFTGY